MTDPLDGRDPTVLYFCDETSQHDTVMAVGGLAVSSTYVRRVQVDIETINYAHKITSEMKWSKAKPLRFAAYLAYIDLMFDLINRNLIHFHIRFQRMGEYDHNLSGKRKRVDTISKAHYQLLLHRAVRNYGNEAKLHIRPDNGACTELLPAFMHRLNEEGERRFRLAEPCIRTIEPRDSSKEPLLQLLDVTLGALTSYRNERHLRPDGSQHKKQLAIYAFQKTGLPSMAASTAPSKTNMSVWNVTPALHTVRGPRG